MNPISEIMLVTVGDYVFNLLDISVIKDNVVHYRSAGKTTLLDEDTARRLRFLIDGLPNSRSADALWESREIVEVIRKRSLEDQQEALRQWKLALENDETNPVPGPLLVPGIQ